ncbi:hypothetical protein F383_10944 [Gossypium arboreum]|uniref:Uncharacterized protein n=1 Tax=Gossypium arboreum TaxID=29729 RepID=A0A0B0N9J3_GOSAR|nr:hypothetical protein F383_10944 [Gossypium arboreum]
MKRDRVVANVELNYVKYYNNGCGWKRILVNVLLLFGNIMFGKYYF